MKFNWGTGLAITLGIFIVGMGTITYKAINQRHDLVTTDYYAKEIAYQQTIEQTKNAAALEGECQLKIEENNLVLHFPKSLIGLSSAAEIEMYSPTHAEKDFNLSFEDWEVASIILPSDKLSSGKWIAKVKLNTDNDGYYFEADYLLP
ncbi:MAG: hypothetical protein ACJAZH_000600 [Roseivirga sp.]|jgi:hypothetical protein